MAAIIEAEAALFANPLQVWRSAEESLDFQFTWNVNENWTLTFDATMMGALEVYAAAGQAVVVSPFIVGGATAPVSVVPSAT